VNQIPVWPGVGGAWIQICASVFWVTNFLLAIVFCADKVLSKAWRSLGQSCLLVVIEVRVYYSPEYTTHLCWLVSWRIERARSRRKCRLLLDTLVLLASYLASRGDRFRLIKSQEVC